MKPIVIKRIQTRHICVAIRRFFMKRPIWKLSVATTVVRKYSRISGTWNGTVADVTIRNGFHSIVTSVRKVLRKNGNWHNTFMNILEKCHLGTSVWFWVVFVWYLLFFFLFFFRCDKCDVQFAKIKQLTKHKRYHKSYCCVCGRVYHKWTLFLEHRRTCIKLSKI